MSTKQLVRKFINEANFTTAERLIYHYDTESNRITHAVDDFWKNIAVYKNGKVDQKKTEWSVLHRLFILRKELSKKENRLQRKLKLTFTEFDTLYIRMRTKFLLIKQTEEIK